LICPVDKAGDSSSAILNALINSFIFLFLREKVRNLAATGNPCIYQPPVYQKTTQLLRGLNNLDRQEQGE
jgi:hypothetical protein